jgi:hypothetical protein
MVVRGGDPHVAGYIKHLMDSARLAEGKGKGFALSVFVGYDPTLTRDELLASIVIKGQIPNGSVAVTTAGELRRRGFPVVANGPLPSHVSVKLGNELTRSSVESFRDAFGPAENNPAARRRNA